MKTNLNYFPLDVTLDDRFSLIESEFGLTGFAVIVKLLQKIYGAGYYCEWSDEVALLFAKSLGLTAGGNVVSEIVKAALRRGIFDKEIFTRHHILTSKEIQEKFIRGLSRCKKIFLKEEYLLLSDVSEFKNVYILRENADTFAESAYTSQQCNIRKCNERKGESGADAPSPSPTTKRKRSTYGWVKLTDGEYDRLVSDYGKETADYYIGVVDEKAQLTGNKNKWKDWNLTVRNAVRGKWGGAPPVTLSAEKDYGGDQDFLRE